MKYPAIIYPAPEGGYVAEILSLPGCLAQGETIEECFAELDVVCQLWLESNQDFDQSKLNIESALEKVRNFNNVI